MKLPAYLALLFALLAACVLLLCGGCASARWSFYPGARVPGQCRLYANAVVTNLTHRHIEAHYIEFYWKTNHSRGYHACVIFRGAEGKWFVVDNEEAKPEPCVRADNVLQLLQHWYPPTLFVRVGADIKL